MADSNRAWDAEKSTWPHHALSRFVTAGGLRWHVQLAGSGPVILMIHGTGASTHTWRDLLPLLTERFCVLLVDLPGHGFTDSLSNQGCSIIGMSSRLGALLRVLKLDVRYCVGHSAGAVLLCRMALDGYISPQVIVSLNGAFLPLAGAAGLLFSPIARLFANSLFLPRMLARHAGNSASVARAIAGTGSSVPAESLQLYTRLVRNPKHVAGALCMMGNWDLSGFSHDLPRLKIPLALVVGENDRTVPPSQASVIAQRVADAKIYRLAGLGHLAHEEQPNLLVNQFLTIFAAL